MVSFNIPKQVLIYDVIFNFSEQAYIFCAPEIR